MYVRAGWLSSLLVVGASGCESAPEPVPVFEGKRQAVVQGSLAAIADFPATIAMLDTNNGDAVFCTGTLLDARHVLTAAHCVANLTSTPTRIDVAVGYAKAGDAPDSSRFNVTDLTVHPDWTGFPSNGDPDGLDVTNDVAVLTLARDVPNPAIATVLSDARIETDLALSTSVEIVGFGKDDDGARGTLRRGTAPVRMRTDQLLLLGELGSADSCEYDSGGPVYLLANDGVFLVGITSREWPGAKSLPCGEGGVYTMPMAYRSFIEERLGAPLPTGGAGQPGGGGSAPGDGSDAGSTPDGGAPIGAGGQTDGGAYDADAATVTVSSSDSEGGCSVPGPGHAGLAWALLAWPLLRRRRARS